MTAKDARIKKLEARLKEIEEDGDCLTAAYMLGGKRKADENMVLIAYVKRLEAAFLDAIKREIRSKLTLSEAIANRSEIEIAARAALEEIRAGRSTE